MKIKSAAGLFLSLVTVSLFGQTVKNSNQIALVKELDVARFTGSHYRLRADIRCTANDSFSRWGIYALQVGKGDYDFINNSGKNNMSSGETGKWETFSVEGTIAPGAKRIWLYLMGSGNGRFCFDNLELKIETDSGRWQILPIYNHDFELTTDVKKALKHFKNTRPVTNNPNIHASITTSDNNTFLLLSSENNVATKEIVYGNNAATGDFVTAKDDKKIYYEIYGEGEPLLLLHGNGGSIRSFKNNIPELAKHYKVIAIDTRGQGKSPDTSTKNFNYEIFTDDVEMLLNKLGLQQVNIAGWSDGAIISLLLSIRHPGLVKKQVLMGANLNPSEDAVESKILQQTRKDLQQLKETNNSKDMVISRLLEMLLQHPNIPVSDLQKITAKTLVMAGEKDLVREKHTRLIAANIPGAQLNIVKKASHFLPEENPLLFNEIVLKFLQEN